MSPFAKMMSVGGVGILIGAGAVTVGIFDSLFSDQKFYSVKLIPQGASGTLGVNLKKGKKCSKTPHDGCMLFEEDKVGAIRFYLPGFKKKVRKCPEAGKVITRIELTAKGQGDDPEAEKGDFTGGVPDWVKQDAFPDVVQATGVIYEEDKDNGRSQVWLVNLNSHDASLGVFPFWYKVTATDCSDETKTWVTDPRGDNNGMPN